MIGQWVAPLLECGIGTALEALRSSGLERAPMTQALTADAMRRRAREFPVQRRALLTAVLRDQCGPNPTPRQLELLDRLAQPTAVTVATGHQLVTAAGPLYVHAKIAETEALAAHWTAKGVPTVPVFWMATEDHDLDEIRRIFWRGAAVGSWPQPAAPLRSGAVPAELAAQALASWRSANALPEPVHWAAVRSEDAYRAAANLADATRALVGQLHPGVLVLDASDARLKAAAAELWDDEIKNQTLYRTRVEASAPWNGAAPPVPMRPSALFALDELGQRLRLDRDDQGNWVRADGRPMGRDTDVANWAAAHPEQVSPNALLRPIYQEWILPNAAYTGGAGEVAYAYQLAPYFAQSGMGHGVWRLRHSGAWLPPTALKARHGLQAWAASQEGVMPSFSGPWDSTKLRADLLKALGAPLKDHRPVAEAIRPLLRAAYERKGLERSVNAWIQRIEREEDRMIERLRRETAHREEVLLRRLDVLQQTLLPGGTLQERVWTHFDLVEHGGPQAVQAYVEAYTRQPHWDAPGWWEFR